MPSAPAYLADKSSIHGTGLFAVGTIAAGGKVIEYKGKQIGKAGPKRGQAMTYTMELNYLFDIDGNVPENLARFINHGCEPNCEAVAEDGRIWICALHDIAAGEELTFDYNFRLAAFPGHPCRCGAKSCAGFIVNRQDRWRVRHLLNRPGRSLLKGNTIKATEPKGWSGRSAPANAHGVRVPPLEKVGK